MTHPKNTTRTISEETQIELMAQSISNIEASVKEIKSSLKHDYASKGEVLLLEENVKSSVVQLQTKVDYVIKGAVFIMGSIGLAIIGAFMNTILRGGR